MNISRTICIGISLLCCVTSVSQTTLSLKGIVKNENNKVVEYATVLLLSPRDSFLIQGCAADSIGRYELAIQKAGSYLIQSQAIGYQSFLQEIELAGDMHLDITLHPDVIQLNELKVIAERIKYSHNKYIVNMANNPLSQGKSIADMITYLPGITKLEDALFIHGEKVSEIYIDGRQVVDLMELEALESSEIDKIEVISDAGQKLRADKGKGVIKISLKKNKEVGYGGNLGTLITFGKEQHSERITFPLSYQKKKVNLYNYIRVNNIDEPYLMDISTEYKQTNKNIHTYTENRFKGKTFSDIFSIVYDISKRQNLGISLNTIQKKADENTLSCSDICGNQAYHSNYLQYGNRRTQQYQTAINYNAEFDDKGSGIHIIGDYLNNSNNYHDNRQELYSAYFNNDTLSNHTQTRSEQIKLRVDVDIRCWGNNTLSLGGDLYKNDTSNDISYYQNKEIIQKPIQDLCDNFQYRGNGTGFYGDYCLTSGRSIFEMACRLQQDRILLRSYSKKTSEHTYFNVFPEMSITYNFNKNKNLYFRLFAKRDMDAIRYSDMNPVRIYVSDVYYERGNPNLEPVTWYSMGINSRITPRLNVNYRYNVSGNDITSMTFLEDAEKGITYKMPINIGRSHSHSINLSYNHSPVKWWTLNASIMASLYSNKYNDYTKSRERLFFTASNDIRLSENCGAEVYLFIERGMHVVETYYHSVYNLYWRLYHYLFHKNLVCSISGNNLWYRNRIMTIDNEIYNRREKNASRRDYASISLTWRIKSGKEFKSKRAKEILRMQETTIGSK